MSLNLIEFFLIFFSIPFIYVEFSQILKSSIKFVIIILRVNSIEFPRIPSNSLQFHRFALIYFFYFLILSNSLKSIWIPLNVF